MIPQAVIRNLGNGSACYAIKGLQRFWQTRRKQLIWHQGRLCWQPCGRAEPEGDWPCCPAKRLAGQRHRPPWDRSPRRDGGLPPQPVEPPLPGECRDPHPGPCVLVWWIKHAQMHPFGLSWRSSASMRMVCRLLAEGGGHFSLILTGKCQATLPFIIQSTSILLLPSALWFVTRTSTVAGCELTTAEMVWCGGVCTVPGTLCPRISRRTLSYHPHATVQHYQY